MSRRPRVDVISENLGTIITIAAVSRRALGWMTRHVPDSDHGYAQCDHRCGVDILIAMRDAGLIMQDAATGRMAVSQ